MFQEKIVKLYDEGFSSVRILKEVFGSCPDQMDGLIVRAGLTRNEEVAARQIACGHTLQDIADMCGISVTSARSRCNRAISKMKDAPAGDVVFQIIMRNLSGTTKLKISRSGYPQDVDHLVFLANDWLHPRNFGTVARKEVGDVLKDSNINCTEAKWFDAFAASYPEESKFVSRRRTVCC